MLVVDNMKHGNYDRSKGCVKKISVGKRVFVQTC